MEKRKSPPFLKNFDQLLIPIIDHLGNPTWPERFSLSKIDEIKTRSGPLKFSSQMLLVPPLQTSKIFDINLINLYDSNIEFFQSNNQDVYMIQDKKMRSGVVSWDPSLGNITSDKSVCVCVFKDEQNKIYIHDIKYLNSDNNENSATFQCDEVINFMHKNHLHSIVIETNGIGGFLSEILLGVAKKKNYPIFIKKINQTQNKNERILNNLQPYLYSSSLFLKSELSFSNLIKEMEDFDLAYKFNKDDTLDAISSAISCNFGLLKRTYSGSPKTYHAKTNFNI